MAGPSSIEDPSATVGDGDAVATPLISLSVVSFAGNEVADLSLDPGSNKAEVLAALREKISSPGLRARLFLGDSELKPGATLEQVGAVEGSRLTLVVLPPLYIAATGTGRDYIAKLWNAVDGECLQTFQGDTWGGVASIAFSPDGSKLTTALDDMTAKLWSTASGECALTLKGHHGGLLSAAFSPDSRQLVTTSVDRTAKVWDAANGQCERTLQGHTDYVWSGAFCAISSRILTASADGTARIWSAATGDCILTLQAHNGKVLSAVFSPDGSQLITSSSDGTAKLWSATSGACIRTCAGHDDWVHSAVFSPSGAQLLTASQDKTAKLWSVASGECLLTLRGHSGCVMTAAFSPDGAELLTAAPIDDRTCRLWLWCAVTGERRRAVDCSGRSAAFAPLGFDLSASAADPEDQAIMKTSSGAPILA